MSALETPTMFATITRAAIMVTGLSAAAAGSTAKPTARISTAATPARAMLTVSRKRRVDIAGTSANQASTGLCGPPVAATPTTSAHIIVRSVPNATSSGRSLRSIQRSIVTRWMPTGTNSATVHQPFQGAPSRTPAPIAPAMTTRAFPMRALASNTRARCAGVGQSHARSDSITVNSAQRRVGLNAEPERADGTIRRPRS